MTTPCAPAETAEDGRRFWSHVKTDGVYEEIARGLIEATLVKCVIYRGHDGVFWVRPSDEFDDGRFVRCEMPALWGFGFRPDASELAAAREEIALLKSIAIDLHWMARRYADGRMTGSPSTINGCTRQLLDMGVALKSPLYARDGMGREFDGLSEADAKAAMDDAPRGYQAEVAARERLASENAKLAGEVKEAWAQIEAMTHDHATDVEAAGEEIRQLKAKTQVQHMLLNNTELVGRLAANKITTLRAQIAALQAAAAEMRAALEFYADPKNWIDTPSWNGDFECITPKAVPVLSEEGRPCDCGDTARAALASGVAEEKA
jgi:hypothetical protein